MMPQKHSYDAIVIGAGPNGLAAAITLSNTFKSLLLVEAGESIGGGLRSAELTLPGFIHDICAAVHPLAIASPFFRSLDLQRHGISWIQPEIPLAHPFKDGSALYLHRSFEITLDALGLDGKVYRELISPFLENFDALLSDILAPLHIPAHPCLTARFALRALRSARYIAYAKFNRQETRALFAGIAAHAMIPLDRHATASFGIVLATLAHAVGWPIIKGGSQKFADALGNIFKDGGGEIITRKLITSIKELPLAKWYFFDITPRQLLNINGLELSVNYSRRLFRYRYGPGVCKVD